MVVQQNLLSRDRVLVTGGTGVLGRQLAPRLCEAGYIVRVLSRRPRPPGMNESRVEWAIGQLTTGEGLADALDSCQVVAHLASGIDQIFPHMRWVDVAGTQRLLEFAVRARVSHVVYISIVGIDRIPFAYYRAKREAERLVRESSAPWSILRATQFYDLIDRGMSSLAHLPIVALPPGDIPLQPVDSDEVAQRLRAAIMAGPSGQLDDFGGPEERKLGELSSTWMDARSVGRPTVHLPLPGKTIGAFRAGHAVVRNGDRGLVTFEEWLARSDAKE